MSQLLSQDRKGISPLFSRRLFMSAASSDLRFVGRISIFVLTANQPFKTPIRSILQSKFNTSVRFHNTPSVIKHKTFCAVPAPVIDVVNNTTSNPSHHANQFKIQIGAKHKRTLPVSPQRCAPLQVSSGLGHQLGQHWRGKNHIIAVEREDAIKVMAVPGRDPIHGKTIGALQAIKVRRRG